MAMARAPALLECVINVSEGADGAVIDALVAAAQPCLLDVHSDPHHHRSVLTLGGPGAEVEEAARAVTTAAVALIDLGLHVGAHPRLGSVDVVPFVPLAGARLADAVAARDRFAAWAGRKLGVPCFVYGPERGLPEVRRLAWSAITPSAGPAVAHPRAGAICVGARPVLVAYNLWLAPSATLATARSIAADLRSPTVRSLGLDLGGRAQVSCNLVEPASTGPGDVYDFVAARAPVERAELVGLVPASVLEAVPPARWAELDLDADRTIEHRLAVRPRRPGAGSGNAGGAGGAAPVR
jgi:glutamate formiminotransferase / 5-formyltetrahydrofolate cyclo-ligase